MPGGVGRFVPVEMDGHDQAFDRVAAALRAAERVLFVTGAGLSADSGLPTYRGVGGIYDRGLTDEGLRIEEALSGGMMRERPEICWKYILDVERACRGARPNRGHEVVAALETDRRDVWVLTQNVDGLHRQAGSSRVIDIHGDVHELRCCACGYRRRVTDFAEIEVPPSCTSCGGLVRPDVVLFGELLPEHKVARLRDELARGFDVVFSVGTSSLFPYIAQPVVVAARRGQLTVEINPELTVVSAFVDVRLPLRAAAALEALAARLGES